MKNDAKVYRDRLMVSMEVAEEVLARDPKAREHITKHAVDEMVHLGAEKYLVFIRPQSVRLSSVRPTPGGIDSKIHRFVWHPSTDDGVEFVGGPFDGEVMPIPMDHGWAPDRWFMHVKETATIGPELTGPPTLGQSVAMYERDGIDRIRDRWVYRFEGMRA